MATEGYNYFLHQAAKVLGPVEAQEGGSGYFSHPESHLDPRLFTEGTSFSPTVRTWILSTLYGYWSAHYNQPRKWSTAWVAGSGISYQWAANRSNGDLDVLIGVDFPKFFKYNQDYVGMGEEDMADIFNRAFKDELWPQTAAVKFPSNAEPVPGAFEVTFYVNPHSTDIRDIKPYAAYDLTHDGWTVRPPILGENPEESHPAEYWDYVANERQSAQRILDEYNSAANALSVANEGTPGWLNAVTKVNALSTQAKTMFDDIHLGRKQAFAPSGQGYGDFYNFRWQAHKRFGTIQALAGIAKAKGAAREQAETALYGHPLLGAPEALRQAALVHRGGPYGY